MPFNETSEFERTDPEQPRSEPIKAPPRRHRWIPFCVGSIVLLVAIVLATSGRTRDAVLGGVFFGYSGATLLFALIPAVGLLWFIWQLFFRRRVRMMKLRRIRRLQGRTKNLLAPPPIFGGAVKDKKARDRDWQQ